MVIRGFGAQEFKEAPRRFAGDGGDSPEDKSLGSGRGLAVPSPDVIYKRR
jgi:hypothetical protein